MIASQQARLDHDNEVFWDTLCGSGMAFQLGIRDGSPESVDRFDSWYFRYYCYLNDHIPYWQMEGKRVLEVGLGYGSVSQRIAARGAQYHGLDIAQGPVDMVNTRLRTMGLRETAQRGSILNPPFGPMEFDYIVAIGCYHHTGDIARAIDVSRRLLRPGGTLIGMVYNAYSYRRWMTAPAATARYMLWDYTGIGTPPLKPAGDISAYDGNAPHTDFVSRQHLERLCADGFEGFRATLENINQEPPFSGRPRDALLATRWPALCGLDIYFHATRPF